MKPANRKHMGDARRAAYKGDVDILRMTLQFNHDYSARTQQLPGENAEKLECNMSILDMAVIGRKPFSCSKLIFKHYHDNQEMLEKLFQARGKHSSLHLACQKQKKGPVLKKLINLYAKYGFKADRRAEHNMSTIAWLLDDNGVCKDPREPLIALLEHGADPSLRVEYKGSRALPEDNGNDGPWAKESEIREDVIEILHKARRQKCKASGKIAQQKFFETLKQTLARNSDENAKSYLDNIADMRERMRATNSEESEVYFGWHKMFELKGETQKTQKQREATEEEYRFQDPECESCLRRECGKYKKRKLRQRVKRAIPGLENESDDFLIKQEAQDSNAHKVEQDQQTSNDEPVGILEQVVKAMNESSQVESRTIEKSDDENLQSSKAKDTLPDKSQESNGKPQSEKKDHPDSSDKIENEKKVRRERLETIEVATLSGASSKSDHESDTVIASSSRSLPMPKIQEENTQPPSDELKNNIGTNLVLNLKAKPNKNGKGLGLGASVTAELVDLDDVPLDSSQHYDPKTPQKVVILKENSPAPSNTSMPEVIDLCANDADDQPATRKAHSLKPEYPQDIRLINKLD